MSLETHISQTFSDECVCLAIGCRPVPVPQTLPKAKLEKLQSPVTPMRTSAIENRWKNGYFIWQKSVLELSNSKSVLYAIVIDALGHKFALTFVSRSVQQELKELRTTVSELQSTLEAERRRVAALEICLRNAERSRDEAQRRNEELQRDIQQFLSQKPQTPT